MQVTRLLGVLISIAAVVGCAPTTSTPKTAPDPLRVALFGWIPNSANDNFASLEAHIESEFSRKTDRAVDVEFRFDEFYDPVGLFKLYQDYDVVEMDAVMLGVAVDEKFIQVWPSAPARNWHPAALEASTFDGKQYGIPHWLCGFFVFTRSASVASQTSLQGLLASISALGTKQPDVAGVLDGSWDSTTMYLSGWLDHGNSQMEKALSAPPDPAVLSGFGALGAACVESGDSPCTNYSYSAASCLESGLFDEEYCHSTSVAPPTRRFALGEVDTLVGYSERLHYVLRNGSTKVPSSIRVVGLPLGSNRKLAVFVDVLTLSKRCGSGSCKEAAKAFADLYTDPALVEYTLLSRDAGNSAVPRYLLPADEDVYGRPAIAADTFFMQLQQAVGDASAYTNDPRIYHFKELYKGKVKEAFKP